MCERCVSFFGAQDAKRFPTSNISCYTTVITP